MNAPSQAAISIDAGEIIHLQQPDKRSTAIHELVGQLLPRIDGDIIWVDALDHADPTVLAEHADHPHRLDRIQIARGFTAYQHHAIIRELPRKLDGNAGMVVVPAATCLYRDDDVPENDAECYLAATVPLLEAVAETYNVPIIISTTAGTSVDFTIPVQLAAHF